jgi:UDP-2-acetamido-3-amino-2,3-dideoxy-glucuronate N-acetyltransferase
MSELQSIYVHPSSFIDQPCQIGDGTKIWHFCHIMSNSVIGSNCVLGQNVMIASEVKIGSNVKIQNNVSIYQGVELEDNVFCGPSSVFTNITNPRSEINRKDSFQKTLVCRGATIGANATIVCGVTIGQYAFIGAGAVIIHDVLDYALMVGIPAKQKGWMSRHGYKLVSTQQPNILICPKSGWQYELHNGVLRCVNWSEELPLA